MPAEQNKQALANFKKEFIVSVWCCGVAVLLYTV